MRKKTKTFVIVFAVLFVIAGLVYASSKINITGGVITGFSIDGDGENNSVREIPGAKLSTGSLHKGLVFDMPLKIGYTKEETPGSEIMTDRTPYSNDGQNYGAVVGADYTTFDGVDDIVNCGNDPSLDLTQAFTISTWLKPHGADEGGYVAGRYQATDAGYMMRWEGTSNQLRFYYHHTGGVSSLAVFTDDDVWVNAVITFDHGDVAFYRNGIPAGTSTGITITSNPTLSFAIGCRSGGVGAGHFFNGSISDVRLYNRVLSLSEIKLLYDRGRR
ncbi:unnamed protein product [marine sediment metagenome]|uniref:LamG-like jellyroll fold domain-containing protein n=1 Tax=marine sediment metagenome TaxID=412755 RepID=X1LWU4_9ZZZZ